MSRRGAARGNARRAGYLAAGVLAAAGHGAICGAPAAAASWGPATELAQGAPGSRLQGVSAASNNGRTAVVWREGRSIRALIMSRGEPRMLSRLGQQSATAMPPVVTPSGSHLIVAFGAASAVELRRLDPGSFVWRSSRIPLTSAPRFLDVAGSRQAAAAGAAVVGQTMFGFAATGRAGPTASALLPAGAVSALGTQPVGPRRLAVTAHPDENPTRLVAAQSVGARFTSQQEVATLSAGTVPLHLAATVRSTGGPVVVVGTRADSGVTRLLAVNGTISGTWRPPTTISAPSQPILGTQSAAVASRFAGNVVVLWRQAAPARRVQIFAASEGLDQRSWRSPVALTAPRRPVGPPVVATGPDGRTITAYTVDGRIYVRQLGKTSSAYRWSRARLVSPIRRRCGQPQLTFRQDGRLAILFACGRTLLARSER